MSLLTVEFALDDIKATLTQMENDIAVIKEDMADLRLDITDMRDEQYEMIKKFDKIYDIFYREDE